MKKITTLIICALVIFSCSFTLDNALLQPTKIDFRIVENKFLIIDNGSEALYASSIISSKSFAHGKDIAIIVIDENGKLAVEKSFKNIVGTTFMINGVDLDNNLIEINDKIYELKNYHNDFDTALDLLSLYETIHVSLNEKNYEEFIDDTGKIYILGEKLDEKAIDYFLYPVTLKGKEVFSITYNNNTGKIYDGFDKFTMLMDEDEAKEIKTIDYIGIYKSGENLAVQINDTYYKLVEKK